MNVLITGATGGIGKSLIDIFIKNNYHVIALGRNVDELKKLQNKYGHMILCYKINLNYENEIDSFFQFLEDKKIKIHILINGAGIGELDFFKNTSYQKIKKIIDTNILALTKFTSYFYKRMIKKGGTIINISSTAGFQCGGPLMAIYYATKSYVNSFTYSLYEESKNTKISIILLAPGPTLTNFAGMSQNLNSLEKLYITSPKEVATALFNGFIKKKFLIIPGKINKILYYSNKLLPSKIMLSFIKKIQEKKMSKE